MSTRFSAAVAFVALAASLTPASAQPVPAQEPAQVLAGADAVDVSFSPLVTAAGTADNVRFTASSGTAEMRVQVTTGTFTVFDSGWRSGNLVDWTFNGPQGPSVSPGAYAVTVTARDLSGRQVQKQAALTILGDSSVTVGSLDGSPLGTIANPGMTVVAHDGTDGEVVSTKGALSFRLGNLFTGKDREVIRLTPEGNVGIGTASPKARLDVNGFIRADGLIFPDGSVLQSGNGNFVSGGGGKNSAGAVTFGSAAAGIGAAVSGTGTPLQVPKWFDGSGTLVDSAITEKDGFVGVGTTNPLGPLHLYGVPIQDMFAGMGVDLVSGPAFNFGYAGTSFGRSAGFLNVRPDALAVAPNPSLRFMTVNVQRMIITNTGLVGIATTNPNYVFSLGGDLDRTMGVDRNASAAGRSLTVIGGGAAVGSTNTAGGDLVLSPGNGTGNAGSGNIRLRASTSSAGGSADGTFNDREVIVGKAKQLALTAPASVALASFTVPANDVAAGRIQYTVKATDGAGQVVAETGYIRYIVTPGGLSCSISDRLTLGTLNVSCVAGFFASGPGVSLADSIAFGTPAAVALHEVYYTIYNTSGAQVHIE